MEDEPRFTWETPPQQPVDDDKLLEALQKVTQAEQQLAGFVSPEASVAALLSAHREALKELTVIAHRILYRERNADKTDLPDELRAWLEQVGETYGHILHIAAPLVPAAPRRSTRKAHKAGSATGLLAVPNVLDHGTRNLGYTVSGAADWAVDPNEGAMLAIIDGETVGRIPIGVNGEEEAARVIDALGPRCIQAMVALSAIIYEKTSGNIRGRSARVTVGELARTMGYQPKDNRTINTDILHRIARELNGLTKIWVKGAETPYKGKKPSTRGWISPLIAITGVYVEYKTETGERLPLEFEVILGKVWAEAMYEQKNLLQVTPGLMTLNPVNDEQAIKLAWYYLTQFRYDMKRGERKYPVRIKDLCRYARLTVDTHHLSRFLDRLERWHKQLRDLGIIGGYERTPQLKANWAPSRIFNEGVYRVAEPRPILEAYKKDRDST